MTKRTTRKPITEFKFSTERRKPLWECMKHFDVGDKSAEWPNNSHAPAVAKTASAHMEPVAFIALPPNPRPTTHIHSFMRAKSKAFARAPAAHPIDRKSAPRSVEPNPCSY